MKNLLLLFAVCAMLAGGILYLSAEPVICADCKQGNSCSTSYDCGEIGVCYCQYSYETEQETGGGIPESGTCYFE